MLPGCVVLNRIPNAGAIPHDLVGLQLQTTFASELAMTLRDWWYKSAGTRVTTSGVLIEAARRTRLGAEKREHSGRRHETSWSVFAFDLESEFFLASKHTGVPNLNDLAGVVQKYAQLPSKHLHGGTGNQAQCLAVSVTRQASVSVLDHGRRNNTWIQCVKNA